jgi:protein-tyrosine phosphatase
MLFDIHTHILPRMDDGAGSSAESCAMLRLLKQQGVDAVIATPHFRGDKDTLHGFFTRRDACYAQLMKYYDREVMPEIYLGAEVRYFKGITESPDFPRLALGKSHYILMEPPYGAFPSGMVAELKNFVNSAAYKLIIAHVDRYLSTNPWETVCSLCDGEKIRGQVNAEALIRFIGRKKAVALLENQICSYLADDTHDMQERKPVMEPAMKQIEKHCRQDTIKQLMRNNTELYHAVKGEILR